MTQRNSKTVGPRMGPIGKKKQEVGRTNRQHRRMQQSEKLQFASPHTFGQTRGKKPKTIPLAQNWPQQTTQRLGRLIVHAKLYHNVKLKTDFPHFADLDRGRSPRHVLILNQPGFHMGLCAKSSPFRWHKYEHIFFEEISLLWIAGPLVIVILIRKYFVIPHAFRKSLSSSLFTPFLFALLTYPVSTHTSNHFLPLFLSATAIHTWKPPIPSDLGR